jgi:hypothetical protein
MQYQEFLSKRRRLIHVLVIMFIFYSGDLQWAFWKVLFIFSLGRLGGNYEVGTFFRMIS